MDTQRENRLWTLTAFCLIFLLIEGTAGSRHPRAMKSKRNTTKLETGKKSGEGVTIGSEGQSVAQESQVKERDESGGQETYGSPTETTTEITGLNFNATGTTQMSDGEAKGAVLYAVIFLLFYTSSIGMVILYNVNHQKKISEHEEMKNAQKEYHRGQELIEVQKRAELYFHFKMLYGQESGSGTPPVDESANATPEPKKKKFFKNSFSLREIPKFNKAASSPTKQKFLPFQRNLPILPEFDRLKIKRPKRFTLRRMTKRGLSFPPNSEEKGNNENRLPQRQLSLRASPPSDESGSEEELATQTWHPGSMTHKNQQMLEDVRRISKAGSRGSLNDEVSRVYVLKKNLQKDRETATPEEMEQMISSV
ncbi:uncharacterized protein LOC135492113 [Lineus longissimus]|uniref:uncharacterized protein LOC135492113 n=1 Tax=Lineus longissimus TaxID=88925 RepID=UPI00315C6C61